MRAASFGLRGPVHARLPVLLELHELDDESITDPRGALWCDYHEQRRLQPDVWREYVPKDNSQFGAARPSLGSHELQRL